MGSISPWGLIGRGMDEHNSTTAMKADKLRSMIPDMKDPNAREILEKSRPITTISLWFRRGSRNHFDPG